MSTTPNFNKISVLGDVASTPELNEVNNEKTVYFQVNTQFRLASGQEIRSQQFRVVLLGTWADIALDNNLKLGDTISVGGFLDVVTYESSYSLDVRSDFFAILAFAPGESNETMTMARLTTEPPPNPNHPPIVDPPSGGG